MTRPLRKIAQEEADPIARIVFAGVRSMVEREMKRLAPPPSRTDAEIMRACRKVAEASDQLEQAKFSSGEITARQALERAARNLVDSGEPWRRTETVRAFKAETRKLAGLTDHQMHFAWMGLLLDPAKRAALWAVLGHFPADHGIVLTHGGQDG